MSKGNQSAIAQLTLTTPLIRGLASSALQPGLRSILWFDAEHKALRGAAEVLLKMIQTATHKKVTIVQLGTAETDDRLWGQLAFSRQNTQSKKSGPVRWQHGLLGKPSQDELRLIIIPDLTNLTLSAARTCVSLIDASVVHLERHGQQACYSPHFCWLASCPSSDVGMVSPHLLDRFALRLTGKLRFGENQREQTLRAWLSEGMHETDSVELSMPEADWETLAIASQQHPTISADALAHIEHYVEQTYPQSARRALALARLAIAEAQISSEEKVLPRTIDRAASTIGLSICSMLEDSGVEEDDEAPMSQPADVDAFSPLLPVAEPPIDRPIKELSSYTPKDIHAGDEGEKLDAAALQMERPSDPYREDGAVVERDLHSLKIPTRRSHTRFPAYGEIIGTIPTQTPQDLALFSTLLEAAKFQPMRQLDGDGDRLVVLPPDLRRYRRAAATESMLSVVLDYTCLKGCHWEDSLLPYLKWAYIERASVCLVQVGNKLADADPHNITATELRAKRILERNVLVPRFTAALDDAVGRATPLAHGLELALLSLKHALQHGRSRVQRAVLVVLSDGRGNVPLSASHNGRIKIPVKREGVESAWRVADDIVKLSTVSTIYLNPQPVHNKELPIELAQRLDAQLFNVLLRQDEEVENLD